MKKNRLEKNKPNMFSVKNPYCIALENAGKRTQGKFGSNMEAYKIPRPHPMA